VTARIGILSTAHLHADAYAPLLDAMDGVDLVGVADANAERGREVAERHGTEQFDRESLLDAVDGVVVCSTNADRARWIRPAADAGVDVLSEKPLSTTVADANGLADRCRSAGVALSVAMPLRHSVPAIRARESLRDGTIGSVRAVSGTNRGRMPGGWFADPDAAGGGAVMDHTVHVVDLVHWLTGERVREVYAETGTRFHDLEVEDVNVLSMELSDGTAFSLDGSWSKPDEWRFWGDATVELVGTDGSIAVDCFDETFAVTDGDGLESVFWGTDPNERMLRQFRETVAGAAPPATPPDDAVDAVAVVEAAYESAERSEPVTVPDTG